MKAVIPVLLFLRKLYYTFAHNWLYIVLAFISPLLLYYVAQGKEIISVLLEKGEFINIFLILLSFQMMFYSIWVIPPWSLEFTRKIISYFNKGNTFTSESKYKIFNALAVTYNTHYDGRDVFPVRNFAGAPMLIFSLLLLISKYQSFMGFWYLLGFLILIISLGHITRNLFFPLFKKINHADLWGLAVHILIILLASLCLDKLWFWPGFISIILLYVYNNSYYCYIEQFEIDLQGKVYKNIRLKYAIFWSLLIFFLFLFSFLTYKDLLHNYSAILIMNVSFTIFIAVIDLLAKTPADVFRIFSKMSEQEMRAKNILKQDTPGKEEIITKVAFSVFKFLRFVAVVLVIQNVFFDTINKHRVRKEKVTQAEYVPDQRVTLKEYFSQWIRRNQFDSSKDTILLVAGQGGGSRAGSWITMNLDSLDEDEVNHLFAISTVSGSSSGANMMLNKWNLEKQGINPKTDYKSVKEFAKKIYTFNYLSSAMWGVLWSDAIRGLFTKKGNYEKDRNYYRQIDENVAFASCYDAQHSEFIKKNFNRDFIENWTVDSSWNLPLFFINSATTQAGKHVIISPVKLEEKIFGTAIDLYAKIKSRTKDADSFYNFPLITGVCLSQSFPFTSAYNYVDGVGNMIDGGLYENSGSNTLYEIYSYLKKIDTSHFKFRILLIQNSSNDNENVDPVNSVLINTLSSVSASPFSGHSHYWENKIIREAIENGDLVDMIYLKEQDKWADIPLGILLSQETVDSIHSLIPAKR